MKNLFLALAMLCTVGLYAQEHSEVNSDLEALQSETNAKALHHKIKALEKGTAADMNLLIQYYKDDAKKRDQITKKLLKTYANSMEAKMIRMRSFITLSDPSQVDSLLQDMVKKYPRANLDMEKTLAAQAYAEVPDTSKAMSYINAMEDPVYQVFGIKLMIDIIDGFDSKTALELATNHLPKAQKINAQKNKSESLDVDPKTIYLEYADRYGKLLFKAKRYEESYKYTAEAYQNLAEKDSELTENYAFLSSLKGEYVDALPILANAVKEGKQDAEYIEQVRKAYVALYPGKDVEVYVKELRKAFIDKIKAHVTTLLIDKAAPDFYVTDVNGKKVGLEDFKGKTIVLDFWATWCGPCVESFPAMQLAVNHYANDPDVKFLFIHTWENTADPLTDAQNFLRKREHNFDLYMDPRDKETRRSAAADAFKVDGIPAKFVIDQAGRIRFDVAGFSGKAEAAAEELIQMVEIARKG